MLINRGNSTSNARRSAEFPHALTDRYNNNNKSDKSPAPKRDNKALSLQQLNSRTPEGGAPSQHPLATPRSAARTTQLNGNDLFDEDEEEIMIGLDHDDEDDEDDDDFILEDEVEGLLNQGLLPENYSGPVISPEAIEAARKRLRMRRRRKRRQELLLKDLQSPDIITANGPFENGSAAEGLHRRHIQLDPDDKKGLGTATRAGRCGLGVLTVEEQQEVTDNMTDCLDFAQALLKHVEAVRDREKIPGLNMRVGMHFGNCVGGMIGSGRVRYDIWGMDVVTGNAMESNGIPGKLCVSQAVKHFVERSTALKSRVSFKFHKHVTVLDRSTSAYILSDSKIVRIQHHEKDENEEGVVLKQAQNDHHLELTTAALPPPSPSVNILSAISPLTPIDDASQLPHNVENGADSLVLGSNFHLLPPLPPSTLKFLPPPASPAPLRSSSLNNFSFNPLGSQQMAMASNNSPVFLTSSPLVTSFKDGTASPTMHNRQQSPFSLQGLPMMSPLQHQQHVQQQQQPLHMFEGGILSANATMMNAPPPLLSLLSNLNSSHFNNTTGNINNNNFHHSLIHSNGPGQPSAGLKHPILITSSPRRLSLPSNAFLYSPEHQMHLIVNPAQEFQTHSTNQSDMNDVNAEKRSDLQVARDQNTADKRVL
eukprot:GDKJ01057277.1.p1 GENE.GDKJ01057277.1~~GDKJ01057277.1.p1  ORF type:complete len:651 (+),score=204.17 GDKJ01057277.1:237-2189(+)